MSSGSDLDRPAPLPQILRILVMGNSTGLVVGPQRRSRAEGTYGEVLERRLRARGIEAILINRARPWELIDDVMPGALVLLAQSSPDVIVLNYGLGEAEPNVFPTPLMRWVTRTRSAPSLNPIVRRVRDVVLALISKFMLWSMPKIEPHLGMRTWRLRPRRFEAELKRFILFARAKTAGLVLVMTPNPPGPLMQKLMPGFKARSELFTEIIRSVVDRIGDPGVQLIESGAVVEKLGWRTAMFDGLHFTARGHEAVAELLDDAISEWLATENRS